MAAPSNSARSTQVFIKVAEWSTEHYTLTKGGEYDCYGSGRFTKAAPHNLDPGNDYNYTVESNGFATGVTDCLAEFTADDMGSVIWWTTSNPYLGSNSFDHSEGLDMGCSSGDDNVCTVKL